MTDSGRWQRIKDLFESARELPATERAAFLDLHCGTERDLREELDSLLSTYDADSGFMETPALAFDGEIAEVVASTIRDPAVGRRIGPYRVTRRIGEGGMGVVYEAVRVDGEFRQRVAIKLIKRGMDSEFILRRFRNERQILAGLTHSNIAKLLDGGATGDGAPYFVLEYIDGELIDEYCRSRVLNTRARVELLLQACAAVEHAHRNRIIHRDIKPGNILVDANGTPKLLDFGIAKLLNAEGGESAEQTVTSLRMITPEYASPEQTRGEPATEKSDVYALGVVLYELLSGRRPALGDTDVPAVDNVPRDLNLVAKKAMHPDPARRYQSVEALSADLHNYLNARSVSARPDSVRYRMSRSIRKHATLAWIVAVIVAAIAAGGISWIIQRGPAALSGGRLSVAVIGFQNVSGTPGAAWLSIALSEMLSAEVSGGGKIRAIPDDSVARMKIDLGLQTAGSYSLETLRRVRANLRPDYVIAGSYMTTGDKPDTPVRIDLRLQNTGNGDSLVVWTDSGTYAELPAMATRAGAKLRQALGVTQAALPSAGRPSTSESARLYAEGLAHNNGFDPLGARALLERAAAEDPGNPLVHSALASALGQLGYEERAAAEAKHAVDLSARLPEEKKLQVEAQYHGLQKKWDQAAGIYRTLWTAYPDNLDYAIRLANAQSNGGDGQAARQTLKKLRDDPAAAADGRVDLSAGIAADSLGDYKEEVDDARRAISKARKADARQLLAEALYYEAWALAALGDMSSSERSYREALQIYSETGNRRRVADMNNGIATLLFEEGKPMESARLLEEALRSTAELGDRSLEGALTNNLARCWQELGELRKAQAAYEHSVVIDRELNNRSNLATSVMNLGGVLKDRGELQLAQQRLSEALELARATGRRNTIAIGLLNLADAHYSLGDLPGASKLQVEGLAVAREVGRKITMINIIKDQGNVLRAQGKFGEAGLKYDDATKMAGEAKASTAIIETHVCRAKLLMDQGKLGPAEQEARQALEGYRKEKSVTGQAMAEALLASVLSRERKAAEAGPLAKSARQRLGTSDALAVRIEVEKAEAQVAADGGRRREAIQIFQRLATEAKSKGLVEIAWDSELGIARVELKEGSAGPARRRARRVEREASARGFFRISRAAQQL